MRRKFTPRPYHGLAMNHLANVERSAIFAKPGMGKSVMALTFLDYLHNVWGESRPSLVLAPLRVARDTWANEAHKWDHLASVEVVPIVGDADQRKAALRKDAPVYTINYDNLVWLREQFTGSAWPFATVVADESTKLKNFRLRQGGVRAQALGKVAHKDVERWINLTGTPASNGLEDLWGQTWFLDAGQRLGRTFSAFQNRWFRPVKNGQFNRWVQADHAQAEIQERIADICLTLDPKDWFDLQDPIVNVIEVELPASARTKYREMERELFTMIEGNEVEAMNAAAKSQKCLQLANGAVYLDPERYGTGTWIEVHMEKLDALSELAEETGDDPLLVTYQFKSDLARLLRAFPEGLDLSKAEDMARAMRGEGKLWFGHPQSMGHGVDGLQYHCNTIVFFAQDWNLEYHDQVLERIGPVRQLQASRTDGVFVHYIVARNTIDELVMARRETKRSVQDLLLEFLKGRK
jgi:SNF2 family DNA or RNA helicase